MFEVQIETHGKTSDVSTPPFWKKLNSSGYLIYSTSDLEFFYINDEPRMENRIVSHLSPVVSRIRSWAKF